MVFASVFLNNECPHVFSWPLAPLLTFHLALWRQQMNPAK
jgi:hypothetical protein